MTTDILNWCGHHKVTLAGWALGLAIYVGWVA